MLGVPTMELCPVEILCVKPGYFTFSFLALAG